MLSERTPKLIHYNAPVSHSTNNNKVCKSKKKKSEKRKLSYRPGLLFTANSGVLSYDCVCSLIMFPTHIAQTSLCSDLVSYSNITRAHCLNKGQCSSVAYKQVKPIGYEAPQGGAYNSRKHLKLETPCS